MIGHNEEIRLMLEEHHKSKYYGEILHMHSLLCYGGVIIGFLETTWDKK